ncbi:hypothetical protein AB1A91_22760, partial [Stenotrophomonas maltophilia]|uniref:hypothetical protein n=1 Tax=Stenotrophomonas maltophilia TaxID=40324 RepID=UPI003453CD71
GGCLGVGWFGFFLFFFVFGVVWGTLVVGGVFVGFFGLVFFFFFFFWGWGVLFFFFFLFF